MTLRKRRGHLYARAAGLKHVQTEFVTYLDPGDTLSVLGFTETVEILKILDAQVVRTISMIHLLEEYGEANAAEINEQQSPQFSDPDMRF